MEEKLLLEYGPNYIFPNGTPLIQRCFFAETLQFAISLGLDTRIRLVYQGEYISMLLFSLLFPASLAQYELLKPIAQFKDENEEREAQLILHMHDIYDLIVKCNKSEIIDVKLGETLELLKVSDSLWYFPIIPIFVGAVNLRFNFYKESSQVLFTSIVKLLLKKGVDCASSATRILR